MKTAAKLSTCRPQSVEHDCCHDSSFYLILVVERGTLDRWCKASNSLKLLFQIQDNILYSAGLSWAKSNRHRSHVRKKRSKMYQHLDFSLFYPEVSDDLPICALSCIQKHIVPIVQVKQDATWGSILRRLSTPCPQDSEAGRFLALLQIWARSSKELKPNIEVGTVAAMLLSLEYII